MQNFFMKYYYLASSSYSSPTLSCGLSDINSEESLSLHPNTMSQDIRPSVIPSPFSN